MKRNKILFLIGAWLSFLLLFFYLDKVVPVYKAMLAMPKMPLPLPVLVILRISDFVRSYNILLILFILPLIILINVALDFYLKDKIVILYFILTSIFLVILFSFNIFITIILAALYNVR